MKKTLAPQTCALLLAAAFAFLTSSCKKDEPTPAAVTATVLTASTNIQALTPPIFYGTGDAIIIF